jgi:hypothetical protein
MTRGAPRCWWLILFGAALALGAGSLFAGTERAQAACAPTHCYGTAPWFGTPTFNGGLAYIDTTQLNIGDQCNEFATSELWVGTAYDANDTHWVEEGVNHGEHNNGVCGSGYEWFWASSLAGAYAEHYPSGFPVSLGTTYVTKIQYQGTGSQAYGAYRKGLSLAPSVPPVVRRCSTSASSPTPHRFMRPAKHRLSKNNSLRARGHTTGPGQRLSLPDLCTRFG